MGALLMLIGWLAMAAGLAVMSLVVVMMAFNNLGMYNIGGVPNSWKTKVITILGIILLGFVWGRLLSVAPFIILIGV